MSSPKTFIPDTPKPKTFVPDEGPPSFADAVAAAPPQGLPIKETMGPYGPESNIGPQGAYSDELVSEFAKLAYPHYTPGRSGPKLAADVAMLPLRVASAPFVPLAPLFEGVENLTAEAVNFPDKAMSVATGRPYRPLVEPGRPVIPRPQPRVLGESSTEIPALQEFGDELIGQLTEMTTPGNIAMAAAGPKMARSFKPYRPAPVPEMISRPHVSDLAALAYGEPMPLNRQLRDRPRFVAGPEGIADLVKPVVPKTFVPDQPKPKIEVVRAPQLSKEEQAAAQAELASLQEEGPKTALPEKDVTIRPVEKDPAVVSLGEQAGLRFSGEQKAQVPGMQDLWDFRLTEPGKQDVSIVVKAGATLDDLVKARDAKIAEFKEVTPNGQKETQKEKVLANQEERMMQYLRSLPEGPAGEKILVERDISNAVENINVEQIEPVQVAGDLVRLIRRADRDPSLRPALNLAFEKVGDAAREQMVDVKDIQNALLAELRAVYGSDAPEMFNHYFGESKTLTWKPALRYGPEGKVYPGNAHATAAADMMKDFPPTGAERLDPAKVESGWVSSEGSFVKGDKPEGPAQLLSKTSTGTTPTPQSIGAGVKAALEKNKTAGFFRIPFLSKTPVKVTGADVLPDFMPKNEANKTFSQKFATEHLPVFKLFGKDINIFGGKARVLSPQDESVAAWYAERHGAGPAVSSALAEQIRGKVNEVFKANASGDLNVALNRPASLKISDVFEGLQKGTGEYRLTPEQTRVWTDILKPVLDRQSELVEQYKLADVIDADGDFRPYFPRIVTKRPTAEVNPIGGNRVGANQFFQKHRLFTTEAEGWSKGVEYSTDVEARLIRGIERTYRAIADARLAEDPALGARTKGQLLADLRSAYAAELATGQMTMRDVKNIANSLQQQGVVWSPAFFGKIFDPKVAKMLNTEFTSEQKQFRKIVADANSFLKALKLGFDFGAGQIQLLPTLYSNPLAWAKAQGTALGAFLDPQVFSEYVRKNQQPIQELAKYGSPVGRLQEMMAGLGQGEALPKALSKIPIVGKAAAEVPKAFGRQFQTALDVARVELWKAWREVTPKDQQFKAVEAIEAMTLSGRMESGMVPHSRALLERVAFLAPSYYRGALNLVAAIGENGVSGKIARKAMGSFMVGGLATYWAYGKLIGMDDAELKARLNPARSDFLMWTLKDGDKKINVGLGGIFRSFLRLTGNVAKTSMERPGDWKSLSSEKNPFTQWYRGHAGPVPGVIWDAFSGRDFLGRKTEVGSMTRSAVTPLALEKGGRMEKAASFMGFSAYEKKTTLDDVAKELYPDKEPSKLSLYERSKVQQTMKRREPVQSEVEERRIRERATDKDLERANDLRSSLEPQHREWLEKNKLRLRSYEEVINYNRTDISLSKEEKAFLQEEITKEYRRVLSGFMQSETFPRLSPANQQAQLDARLAQARTRARVALLRFVRTSSSGSSNKPRE